MTQSHGGKRIGAGRKARFNEPTRPIRVPESCIVAVKDMLSQVHELRTMQQQSLVVSRPAANLKHTPRPLFSSSVPAGFPSPADDYIEGLLDLNDKFIHNAPSTFFVAASGDSMNLAGIFEGSILCVDKSLTAKQNDIVIATVNGEFTVKRYYKQGNCIELRPESTNPAHKVRSFSTQDDFAIWGVVYSVHSITRR